MAKRQFISAANWKMNKMPNEVESFFQELRVPSNHSDLIVIFPQTLLATRVQQFIPKKTYFQWGGQNIHYERSGAFTGENSGDSLKKLGAQWVLVGHSERRALFGETDSVVAKKVRTAQDCGLTPMICLGESLQERDAGHTNNVIERQLNEGLKLANPEKPIAIAYEPIWAIGTGRVATPDQVSEAHKVLRACLKKLWPTVADGVSILYGGSVTAQNCVELAAIEDVDGFLVGGASLSPESFSSIIGHNK